MASEQETLIAQNEEAYRAAMAALARSHEWGELYSDEFVRSYVGSDEDPTWNIKVEGPLNKPAQVALEYFEGHWNQFQEELAGIVKKSEIQKVYPDGSKLCHEELNFTQGSQHLWGYHTRKAEADGIVEEVISDAYLPELPSERAFRLNFLLVQFIPIDDHSSQLRAIIAITPPVAVPADKRRELSILRAVFYSRIVQQVRLVI
ncbi:unnamed protein product [Blepharisma stoltei]|uniref:Uncharacterized protein n=1 Tax=Blepharisma stoltei TaxID=1481888 RepID=A0AAU9IQD6_9CILI|nr:unnamed protein product [Blepharisma stoltei]